MAWAECVDCGKPLKGERLRCDRCHDKYDDNDFRYGDPYLPPWGDLDDE